MFICCGCFWWCDKLICVPPASICWALGRFLMFISCLSEHPVNLGERAHPFQNTKWVQAGSGDFSALLLKGNWFPVSFLLARCCHLHSHWVPPSHANNPMAINRAVHGRQRKERDMLTPLSLHAMVLDKWVGEQGQAHASQERMPGTRQLPAWSRCELLSVCQNLVLLWEPASLGSVYTTQLHNNPNEGTPSSLQRRNTSYEGFVDPVILILCQGSQWAIRCKGRKVVVCECLLWNWCFRGKTLAVLRTSVSWDPHTQASHLQRGASRKCVGEERERRGRGEGEERTRPPLSAFQGAAFVILTASLESFLVEPIIPAATRGPQCAFTISSPEVPGFYLYLKLSLSTRWERQWKE